MADTLNQAVLSILHGNPSTNTYHIHMPCLGHDFAQLHVHTLYIRLCNQPEENEEVLEEKSNALPPVREAWRTRVV